jgi:hypothetical protein
MPRPKGTNPSGEPDSSNAKDQGEDGRPDDSYLDRQEEESFPASDPHSDWAGPPV